MAYEKQNFTDGLVLRADQLNHIEDGIEACVDELAAQKARIDQITQMIIDLHANG